MARAEATSDDPAMQVVAFIRLFEDAADEMVSAAAELPLRLVHLRPAAVRGRHERRDRRTPSLAWRERLAEKLATAAELHPPTIPVDPDALADHVFATFEGAFVLATRDWATPT